MEMHWSFECSNVLAPIVKAVAPHDHYRIWKKGSWLRMDSTITGMYMYTLTAFSGMSATGRRKCLQVGCAMLSPKHAFLCFFCFCGHASG